MIPMLPMLTAVMMGDNSIKVEEIIVFMEMKETGPCFCRALPT